MILQSTDGLEEYIGNKYSLVIVAAKRARQLREGHRALAQDTSENFLSLALREVEEKMLQPIAPPEEELAPAPRDVIASLVAGAEFDLDDDMDLEDNDAVDDLAALLVGGDPDDDEEDDTDPVRDVPGVVAVASDDDEDDGTEEEDDEDDEVAVDTDDGDEEDV